MDSPRTIGDVIKEDATRRLLANITLIDWRSDMSDGGLYQPLPFSLEWERTRINVYSEIFGQLRLHVWLEIDDGRIRVYAYSDEIDEPVILTINKDKITVDDQQYS
jgi:hypothetical protein